MSDPADKSKSNSSLAKLIAPAWVPWTVSLVCNSSLPHWAVGEESSLEPLWPLSTELGAHLQGYICSQYSSESENCFRGPIIRDRYFPILDAYLFVCSFRKIQVFQNLVGFQAICLSKYSQGSCVVIVFCIKVYYLLASVTQSCSWTLTGQCLEVIRNNLG